jgi:hypothetical protein
VYEATPRTEPRRPIPAWIVATTSLRRDGLTRAARVAGLQPVAPSEAALIGLHCDEDADTGAPVDVCAGLDRLTVTIVSDPGPATWAALLALTQALFGNVDGTARSDPLV